MIMTIPSFLKLHRLGKLDLLNGECGHLTSDGMFGKFFLRGLVSSSSSIALLAMQDATDTVLHHPFESAENRMDRMMGTRREGFIKFNMEHGS
jgi:hypothetical protein